VKTPERLTDEVLRPAKSLEEESAHLKQLQVQIDALTSVTAAGIVGPPQVDSTTGEPHTGAMIALVPKAPPMWVLEYPQAEEADSLHVTLAYLGDTDLIPDHILYSLEDSLNLLGRHTPVIEGKVFGASVWNAESDTPSLNLAVGGPALEYMHDYVRRLLFNLDEDFDWEPPEQHLPWVAHMCLAYGDSDALTGVLDDALKLEGPIEFDRIRLAYGGEAIDFALVPREMVAAAEPLPEPGPPPTYEPPVTPVTPILPAGTVALDDLVRIERAWRKEIQQVIIPELEKTMRKAADAVLESISFEAPVLWDASHPAAQLFLTQTANQLVGVGEDMWERTRDQLIMGMQEGDSIQQLSARVKEVLSTTDTRARMIARTEVIAASNAGAMQQLEMLGEDAPAQKTWLATHDARTRLSHMAANGQTVDFVMPFTVGGAKFDYPGDPDAPASERVNCRCTLTWHFEDLPLQSIRSAGVLEMFKGHDRYVRDNHGRFAPKGGGGGGGATGGEKKVLKPAHVDTKRLNPAEAAELADIQAKHKSGELSDKEAKYKTYYVKVKASKRINKSGGGGGGGAGGAEKKLEPEKTPTPPWKEPGYAGHNKPSEPKVSYVPSSGMKSSGPLSPVAKGDTVSTPAGVGKVVGTDGDLVRRLTAVSTPILSTRCIRRNPRLSRSRCRMVILRRVTRSIRPVVLGKFLGTIRTTCS
jgi:2'-5' RNA ligase